MRIAIISDVHANLAALEAIEEPYDLLFCLGDLVDYGPQPREAIHWVKERALRVVRGHHDHALAYEEDCRCAPVMRESSVTTREWHSRLLSAQDKQYLHGLPIADRVASRERHSIWLTQRRPEISTITTLSRMRPMKR